MFRINEYLVCNTTYQLSSKNWLKGSIVLDICYKNHSQKSPIIIIIICGQKHIIQIGICVLLHIKILTQTYSMKSNNDTNATTVPRDNICDLTRRDYSDYPNSEEKLSDIA